MAGGDCARRMRDSGHDIPDIHGKASLYEAGLNGLFFTLPSAIKMSPATRLG